VRRNFASTPLFLLYLHFRIGYGGLAGAGDDKDLLHSCSTTNFFLIANHFATDQSIKAVLHILPWRQHDEALAPCNAHATGRFCSERSVSLLFNAN
jgi:hypothetical protein